MLGRLTWTDIGLVLLLAIPATATPDIKPRAGDPAEAAASAPATWHLAQARDAEFRF